MIRRDSQDKLKDVSDSVAVESLFSTCHLLNTYLSPDVIQRVAGEQLGQVDARMRNGVLWGYKLLIVATLDSYINGVVRSPDVLGIEADPDYYDYWAFTKGRGREITRSAARENHYISRFVEKANLLISDLISLKSWDDIDGFEERTRAFRNCLRRISEKAYVALSSDKEVPVRRALLEASVNILWSTSGNPTPIAYMYTDYFVGRKGDDAQFRLLDDTVEECDTSSAITRLDYSPGLMSGISRALPTHWAFGYALTLHESLKKLTGNSRQATRLRLMDDLALSTKNWRNVDSYSRKLSTVYGLPSVYSGCRYRRCSIITDEDREPLTAKAVAPVSPERLLSIFGNRARIVERGSPAACFSCSCLLDGAMKRDGRTGQKTSVALVVHKSERRRGYEDYSIAVLMPAYGLMSNASMWWVFYDIGSNHSGSASYTMKQVLMKIRRNRKSLDVFVVSTDKREFYEYCEDPGYVRLRNAIAVSNTVVSDIRGALPELLLGNLLTNMCYTKVLNRLRPEILRADRGELDVVGVRFAGGVPSQIMVFESKGKAADELELQHEIDRFSRNISIVRRQLNAFCDELEIPYAETIEVKAIFVSMADLKAATEESVDLLYSPRKPELVVPESIELWDYHDLVAKLNEHGVPTQYQGLLKKTQIAVMI